MTAARQQAAAAPQPTALIRIVQKAPTIALPMSPLPLHSTPPEQILEEEADAEEEEDDATAADEGLDLS